MKLTMLGTGNAGVTECYNTCFVLEHEGEYLLVDGGGGNGLLKQLKAAGIRRSDIRHIFVTHRHTDHLLGILWMLRLICQHGDSTEEEFYIYSHDEVIDLLRELTERMFPRPEGGIPPQLHLVPLEDGQEFWAIGHRFQAFDIQSVKAKQFGFTMYYGGGKKLTCCGDEAYRECERDYVQGSTWLLHEAFCLESEADMFHPHEKQHSSVKDACQTAQELGVENLLLYHTEEKNLANRKRRYTEEGRPYFSGNLFVPDDLEVLVLL